MPSQDKRQARVLVVENEPDQRRLMARLLSNAGIGARSAGSFEEATAALRESRFDLVVGDFSLGTRTLVDLLQPGLADPRRLVVVTGNPGVRIGPGVPVLLKPIDPGHLLTLVRAKLESARVSRG